MAKTKAEQRPDEVAQVVQVDSLDVDGHFNRLPADIARWTERYADALGRALRAEARQRRTFAELFLEYKATLLENGKNMSEEVAKYKTRCNPKYVEAQDAEIDAEVARVRIEGVLNALRAKKDALVSLGAGMRAEMNANPSIRGDRAEYDRASPRRLRDDED